MGDRDRRATPLSVHTPLLRPPLYAPYSHKQSKQKETDRAGAAHDKQAFRQAHATCPGCGCVSFFPGWPRERVLAMIWSMGQSCCAPPFPNKTNESKSNAARIPQMSFFLSLSLHFPSHCLCFSLSLLTFCPFTFAFDPPFLPSHFLRTAPHTRPLSSPQTHRPTLFV